MTPHPQFFHTLVPGFHNHLLIPVNFFSKYIGVRSGGDTAELRSDVSDSTWKVKMNGRRLCSGWEQFAVDNDLRIGDVLAVKYEGDMVFHVSDLGPNYFEIRDMPPSSNNNDKTLLKKRLYPRTQVEFSSNDGDGGGDEELPRKKKVKMNSPETEAGSCSPDNSFVALVTASNLRTDTLYLPQHFTSSNGFTRRCRKIVLIDGGERSWALDLRFNESADTFYISRGWRNFCDDNDQKAGGFFMFRLVGNGETPVLSFCPTESYDDRRQRDSSDASGRESLSTELSSGEENTERESSEDKCSSLESLMEIEGESSEDECSSMESLMEIEKKKYSPKQRDSSYSSYSPCHKRSVTFTLPPDYVRIGKLCLPRPFLMDNGINKPAETYILGKDGKKWPTNLLLDKKGTMSLGKGWKEFVKANGLETGFTLKLIWEDTTPVLSLCPAECSTDRGAGGGCSETHQKNSLPIKLSGCSTISKDENIKEISTCERGENHLGGRDSTPSSEKQFATLKITPSSLIQCRLNLPAQFARENSINKPGMTVYLFCKDGTKWLTTLLMDNRGRVGLGKGWKEFAEANGLKSGDSFAVELIWEDSTPMLSLVGSEANEKESISTEPISRDSCSAIQDRSVTLALTPEDVRACKLHLPSQFMKANGINKLGEIILLGENGTEWSGYLMSKDGTVALGKGWDEFCEANGVKLGEPFALEFINEQDKTSPVLKFCSQGD